MKLRRFRGVKNPPSLQPVRDQLDQRVELPEFQSLAKPEKRAGAVVDLRDPELSEILRKLRDNTPEAVTKGRRVLGIMREVPNYSDLEALVAEYLRRKEIPYDDQVYAFGGRNSVAGTGLVIDFVVRGPIGWIAWAAHGLHWHSRLWEGDADFTARLKALAWEHLGVPIVEYITIWEDHAWIHQDRVFDHAVLGLEWQPGRRV